MDSQKHLFSLDPEVHYLNCASKSPLLKTAETAAVEALIRARNPMQISANHFYDTAEDVRKSFGAIVNCAAANVALIPSSSYGFSSILKNTLPKKNGTAIVLEEEFPSGYFAAKQWCVEHQNELVVVKPETGLDLLGKNWNSKILEAIDENTSLVLISAIHWMTGLKYDLKAIGAKCAAVGAYFIVDGSQAVGALPIDVEALKIDALISAGYKWLFGSYSLGIAYIGDKFNSGTPLEESWMNRTNARDLSSLTQYEPNYQPHAGRYNVGETSNFILMPILKAGLAQVNAWEVPNIQTYTKDLIQPLLTYLRSIGSVLESEAYFSNHLFALSLPEQISLEQLQTNLTNNKVVMSSRGKYLRVSVNVFNDSKDIEQLIHSIKSSMV
jgi:selenocysteine lyase/cysteine desulfurase